MQQRSLFSLVILLTVLVTAISAIDSSSIQVGGIYKMELYTGDLLEGIIESKTDTSLIIDCAGKPYTFNFSLISRYTMLSAPKPKMTKKTTKSSGPQVLTFLELLHRGQSVDTIIVQITSGTKFKGVVSAIDTETVQLNVTGSVIPISKDIITTITTHVAKKKKPKVTKSVPMGPFDSIYVNNSETGEYGQKLPPLLTIGTIISDSPESIKVRTLNNLVQEIERRNISQIRRHSADEYQRNIATYAKPLFCRGQMILIDLPPGQDTRPFFKVCIDKYEYPNKKDQMPQRNVSFKEAQTLCKQQGKRLCTVEEWQWACSGLENYPYPYGFNLQKETCNREGIKRPEPSGARYKCVGKFGVYDMVGNMFEWVVGKQGEPYLMGGPLSKCQTISPGLSGTAKPQVGLRCCASN